MKHIHVLADRTADTSTYSDDRVSVHRCWTFDGVDQPMAIARVARQLKVEALWCNLHLTSAGNSRSSWFAGLVAPMFARLCSVTTIVTLHNMLGLTDVKWAGPETNGLDQLGAHLATTLLRSANVVCVLVPEYVGLLRDRYGLKRVRLMPHGTLGTPAGAPAIPRTCDSLLAFGHFGSYKRLDNLIDVMFEFPDLTLLIAGTDSRHTPGYLATLEQRYREQRNVIFLGYVPEADVSRVFRSASVCVLPYATMSGMSGVAIQAGMYGVPLIASDIPGFRSMSKCGLRINFFTWGDKMSLRDTIVTTLASSQSRYDDALHNLAYCRGQMMDAVVDSYLDLIEGEVAAKRGVPTELARVNGPIVVGSK